MKIATTADRLYLRPDGDGEKEIIKGLPGVRYDRKSTAWVGMPTLELLERLERLIRLPSDAQDMLYHLRARRAVMDAERVRDRPVAMYAYPVKVELFAHQIKAANMAMLAFGWK